MKWKCRMCRWLLLTVSSDYWMFRVREHALGTLYCALPRGAQSFSNSSEIGPNRSPKCNSIILQTAHHWTVRSRNYFTVGLPQCTQNCKKEPKCFFLFFTAGRLAAALPAQQDHQVCGAIRSAARRRAHQNDLSVPFDLVPLPAGSIRFWFRGPPVPFESSARGARTVGAGCSSFQIISKWNGSNKIRDNVVLRLVLACTCAFFRGSHRAVAGSVACDALLL